MSSEERDLRDLVFGDALSTANDAELQAISSHPERSHELNRLLRLRETMLSLREEEPPRRTVLVAPVVPVRASWWRGWLGNPGWAFGGACALAAAIVFHAVWMGGAGAPPPSQVTVVSTPTPALSARVVAPQLAPAASQPEALDPRVLALVDARVNEAVRTVRADLSAQHQQETQRLLAATENRLRGQYEEEMVDFREAMYFMKKQFGRQLVANAAMVEGVQ
ncbi:MAG: hypothetical protein MUF01_15585 [Bryobacterales bacterium]|nr:hypothetical protein [Bryobacterales bacterium]